MTAYQDLLVPYIYAGDLSPRRWGFFKFKGQNSVDGNVSRDEFGPMETLPLLVIPLTLRLSVKSAYQDLLVPYIYTRAVSPRRFGFLNLVPSYIHFG